MNRLDFQKELVDKILLIYNSPIENESVTLTFAQRVGELDIDWSLVDEYFLFMLLFSKGIESLNNNN